MIPIENLNKSTRYIFHLKPLCKGTLLDKRPPITGWFDCIHIEKSDGTVKLGIIVKHYVPPGHRIRTFIPNVMIKDIQVDHNED